MDVRWEKQSARILTESDVLFDELFEIEMAARACYNSIPRDDDSTVKFVSRLIDRGEESPVEFSHMHVAFRTSRAIANEIVRHRLFSYAQESTRYVNYEKQGYISCILPDWGDTKSLTRFEDACASAANTYEALLKDGCTPQEARDVLPLATATTLHVNGNFREWRHFFKLRTSKRAHPEMQILAKGLLRQLLDIDNMDIIFGEFAREA